MEEKMFWKWLKNFFGEEAVVGEIIKIEHKNRETDEVPLTLFFLRKLNGRIEKTAMIGNHSEPEVGNKIEAFLGPSIIKGYFEIKRYREV